MRRRPKRKTIPKAVKVEVRSRQNHHCADCRTIFTADETPEFDHRPAIWERPVDENGTDTMPPMNDPAYIDALCAPCHLKRTVGRIPGAERTVTTKGSDAWRRAKFNRIEGKLKPRRKAKIPSRPFPKQKRSFR